MSKKIVVVGDMGTDHENFPPSPVTAGSPDVFVDSKPVGRVGDPLEPHAKPNHPPHPRSIASGSTTVLINGRPAALTGGSVDCGGVTIGSGSVIIGDDQIATPSRSLQGAGVGAATALHANSSSANAHQSATNARLNQALLLRTTRQPGTSALHNGQEGQTGTGDSSQSQATNEEEDSPRTLRLGVFFDGTGNHMQNDQRLTDRDITNVARLYDFYRDLGSGGTEQRIYVEGPGTVDGEETDDGFVAPEDSWGLALGLGATGGHARIESVLNRLRRILLSETYDTVIVDVFGFSRGAALARHFVNLVNAWPESIVLPELKWWPQPRIEHREVAAFPQGVNASVGFVGLFDTVGSFYFPGNDQNFDFNLNIGAHSAEQVVHLTAFHEIRTNFPLSKISGSNGLPGNFIEVALPGVHSDVGGGYENPEVDFHNYERFEVRRYQGHGLNPRTIQSAQQKITELNAADSRNIQPRVEGSDVIAVERRPTRKELSYYALHKMYDYAVNAGVPLDSMDDYPIPAPLQDALNQWQTTGGDLMNARDYLYDYIHTSYRVGPITSFESIAHRPEPNRIRRFFLSNSQRAAQPRGQVSHGD
ncbi:MULTISPECIES: type VI secretion system PAAR protein [unclassified Halomonas]|uniref:type VI secretion system PAAR protein n=1 Tax=unclassified Halomonas TaxID=2609666 RepID=UPI000AE1B9CB|nr:type VI secretion system PAAR protein [Halomonas sp. ALS9]